jgi:hypothetical protein
LFFFNCDCVGFITVDDSDVLAMCNQYNLKASLAIRTQQELKVLRSRFGEMFQSASSKATNSQKDYNGITDYNSDDDYEEESLPISQVLSTGRVQKCNSMLRDYFLV